MPFITKCDFSCSEANVIEATNIAAISTQATKATKATKAT